MTINCIIVEDEPLGREKLRGFIGKLPNLKLSAEFDNAADALAYVKTHTCDLIFLDINLGGTSGIEMLEKSNIGAAVVITTAFPDYAIKGFELRVADYLLKPFTFERFVAAVDRVRELAPKPKTPSRKFIFVRADGELRKILVRDILWIEGMGDYRLVRLSNGKVMTTQTLSEFEEALPASQLCRVHKSWMVAIDKIEAVDRDGARIGDRNIPVSATYREKFFRIIGQPLS